MSQVDGGARPVPRIAFERWTESLARAGWPVTGGSAPGHAAPGDPVPGDPVPGDRATELVPVGEALGRVTAAPVTARWPSPRSDCAAMDGIAVRAADLAAAGTAGDAGDGTVRLAAGTFEWIDTGDPMPDGADTVVMREWLLPRADGSVLVTTAAGGDSDGRRVP
ncbi:MAG TPA: hypothetical protein VF838_11075, partial [Trebonia sp.]